MKFRTPSPGTVIACIALFVVLGGGAYAATKITKLPKNIVKAKNIHDGAVTEKKIKNGAVTQVKLAPGVGSTPAYARVTNSGVGDSAPVVDAAKSKNVTVTSPTGTDAGLVCIDASVPVKSLNANVEVQSTGVPAPAEVQIPAGNTCPGTADALVRTGTNVNFYVTLFN
ncbi:MAG: hypothetical protein ABR536_03870 [Solirubrobacterales bacterium]